MFFRVLNTPPKTKRKINTVQKTKFSAKGFFSICVQINPQFPADFVPEFPADLITFAE